MRKPSFCSATHSCLLLSHIHIYMCVGVCVVVVIGWICGLVLLAGLFGWVCVVPSNPCGVLSLPTGWLFLLGQRMVPMRCVLRWSVPAVHLCHFCS